MPLGEITLTSIQERRAIDKQKPSRLPTWEEIDYLLDRLHDRSAVERGIRRCWDRSVDDKIIDSPEGHQARMAEYVMEELTRP